MKRPMMSGHCAHPAVNEDSHARCHRQGGGQRANPEKEFQPCPCACHYGDEEFECGGCGRPIREALTWPLDDDGDVRYSHMDKDGRALGEDCAG